MTLKEAWNDLLDRIKNYAKIFEDEEERQIILNDLDVIRPYLVTPTADEVCKALSEHLKEEVKYIPHKLKKNGFYLVDSGIYLVSLGYDNQVNFSYNDWIKFNRLPPHLIMMIGRFYEGLEVEE